MVDKIFKSESDSRHMGTGVLGIVGLICMALFAIFIRFAFEADGYKASRWFFISFLPLGVFSILWAVDGVGMMMQKNIILGIVGAAVGASGFIFIGYALGDSPKTNSENMMADNVTQNVTSYNQQGGITAGTVNVAPQRLVFSPEIGADLLAKMPVKKKVFLYSVGGDADQAVGRQVESFLRTKGYDVVRIENGAISSPPDKKYSVLDRAEGYNLILAPSAN